MSAERKNPAAGHSRAGSGLRITDAEGNVLARLDDCWFARVSFGPPKRRGERPCAVGKDGKFMRPARGYWVEVGRTYDCICAELEKSIVCVPMSDGPATAASAPALERRTDANGKRNDRGGARDARTVPAAATAPAPTETAATEPLRPKLSAPERNVSGGDRNRPVKRPSDVPVTGLDRFRAKYGTAPMASVLKSDAGKDDESAARKRPDAPKHQPKSFAEAVAAVLEGPDAK